MPLYLQVSYWSEMPDKELSSMYCFGYNAQKETSHPSYIFRYTPSPGGRPFKFIYSVLKQK